MSSMLKYVGFSPVQDIFVVIIALTPIARNSQIFNSCSRIRWNFLEQLKDWTLILRIADAITNAKEHCYIGNSTNDIKNTNKLTEAHSTAATQLMLDLIEKLSLEDTGELLLQPLGFDTSIIDKFINTAVSPNIDDNIRRSACKLVCFLLRRAAEPDILCIVNTAPGQPPQQTTIPNRLYPLRERIVLHIETRLNIIFDSISNFQLLSDNNSNNGSNNENSDGSYSNGTKYSGYTVRQPFTSLRATLVELIVLMAESDEAVASTISVELWKDFMNWTVKYGFNSIYHALFYRLVFAVLR